MSEASQNIKATFNWQTLELPKDSIACLEALKIFAQLDYPDEADRLTIHSGILDVLDGFSVPHDTDDYEAFDHLIVEVPKIIAVKDPRFGTAAIDQILCRLFNDGYDHNDPDFARDCLYEIAKAGSYAQRRRIVKALLNTDFPIDGVKIVVRIAELDERLAMQIVIPGLQEILQEERISVCADAELIGDINGYISQLEEAFVSEADAKPAGHG